MLIAIPLTIIPLILFNLIGFAIGGDPWGNELFGVWLLSGVRWSLSLGDLMIALALVLLFFEVLRSARYSAGTIYNHIVSTVVLIIYIVEFLAVGAAASSVFFLLTLIALFDVVAGFSVSIRTATRDIALGPHTIDGPPS
jgi:hypothetical protein